MAIDFWDFVAEGGDLLMHDYIQVVDLYNDIDWPGPTTEIRKNLSKNEVNYQKTTSK